jgi:hypothetical protein
VVAVGTKLVVDQVIKVVLPAQLSMVILEDLVIKMPQKRLEAGVVREVLVVMHLVLREI